MSHADYLCLIAEVNCADFNLYLAKLQSGDCLKDLSRETVGEIDPELLSSRMKD